MSNFDNIKINDVLNFLVSNMSTENPLDYFDKIYSSINPIMMMNAVEAAKELGAAIAKKAKAKKIKTVVFDRGGYIYHGVVKALAEAAREAGLEF